MKKEKNLKKETFQIVKQNFILQEQYLSEYATKSKDAIRLKEEIEDIRPPFFRDIDRILHSQSYTRYIDKTQVYSYKENDHISKRMTHVQLVSKIARTIGRALRLNTDLIEAIALGHDIGHTPLGHAGEKMLNKLSLLNDKTYFAHNIHSVRDYMFIENNGKGLNLTIQVLDGIMCHNGEILSEIYKPQSKTKEEFLKQYEESFKDLKKSNKNRPMTLEGCVVRLSDIIAYIGRDIEDAITLGIFKRENLPTEITDVLGNNNKDIVNTIILDIIEHSLDKPYIKMSNDVFNALLKLKNFNTQTLYLNSLSDKDYEYYYNEMNKLYRLYLKDIDTNNEESVIYELFINGQSNDYLNNTNKNQIVKDFIAGMTDDFFMKQIINNNKYNK